MRTITTKLQQLLSKHEALKLVILFGSLARGEEKPDSDLDIAMLGEKKLTAECKSIMIEFLAQHIGRPVDLIDLNTVGEPLLGEILKGERVLGSDAEFAKLLSRHLLDVADFLPLQQRILKERRDLWLNS